MYKMYEIVGLHEFVGDRPIISFMNLSHPRMKVCLL